MLKRFLVLLLALLCCLSAFVACDEEEHIHAFSEWQTVTALSCGEQTVKVRACACGELETQTEGPVSEQHTMQDGTCTTCGHTHSYGEWHRTSLPLYSGGIVKMRLCSCGDVETRNADFVGESVTVLYWSDSTKAEFAQTEESSDAVLSSLCRRDKAVEEHFGLKLEYVGEPGSFQRMNTFVQRVNNTREAGTNDFDIIASYSRAFGTLMMNGLLQDIAAIEDNYIDFERPWWPKGMNDSLAIGNSLYGVTGEISANAINKLQCVYFNKTLLNEKYGAEAEAYFLENGHAYTQGNTATDWLYEQALGGTWTVDDLILLSSGCYDDKTDNGVSLDDQFGLCGASYTMAALYGGAGLRMIESEVTGTLKISDDWMSSKTGGLVQKLGALMTTFNYCGNNMGANAYVTPFARGNSVFFVGDFDAAEDYFIHEDSTLEYGILPLPKFSDTQENYRTVIGNEFSVFSIFAGAKDRGDKQMTLSMLTAVLDCWASEAYRKTTPAIFERNMPSATEEEKEIFELIRKGLTFDFGRVLVMKDTVGAHIYMDSIVIEAAQNGSSWSVEYVKYLDSIRENLGDFAAKLQQNAR